MGRAPRRMVWRVDANAGGEVRELADQCVGNLIVTHRVAVIANHRMGNMAARAEVGIAAKVAGANHGCRMYLRFYRQGATERPGVDPDAMINQHEILVVRW